MRGMSLGWLGVVAVALVACGGIAVIDGDSGAGSGAGGATGSGSASGASGPAGNGGNGASSPASTGAGSGVNCPGCPAGNYCDYPDNLCGQGQTAVCTPKPADCSAAPFSPTCGCDGVVYDSPCQASLVRGDVSVLEICPTPDGTFPCGQTFCSLGSEYCQVVVSDVGNEPTVYSCVPLPDQCLASPDPGCDCLQGEPCSIVCDEPLPFRFRLTCPGG